MDKKKYNVAFTAQPPEIDSLWDSDVWKYIPALEVACYRKESSAHRPKTECKLLYNLENIYGIFRVEDKYVRCIHTEFQSEVYKDSCVEFFVQPKCTNNYFNFEFNCGGALLASYITDPTRIAGRVKEFTPLVSSDDLQIKRHPSLPRIVEPEANHPIIWFLGFSIPFAVLEKYTGIPAPAAEEIWRANFYKCGNETSHPHWGSWSPVHQVNFHLPADFGEIQFSPHN
ncbi:MAG: carbohydrate-binding family 9-like protein [Smithella sp.]